LDSTYLVTRRTEERRRFLNPCLAVNQMVLYCFAYAAQKYGVDLHSLVAMGNHVHDTVTDVQATLPRFCQWAHTHIARGLNSWMGRFGCFWDGTRSYNACLLGVKGEVDPLYYAEDALEAMVYGALNPVAAGLVKHARDWPGINSVKWHIGEPIEVARPGFFFDPEGALPETVTFAFTKPPGFADLDDDAFDRLFRERVRDGELELRREMKAAGRSFAGVEKVLQQSRLEGPKTVAPRFEIEPQVASNDEGRRVSMLMLIAAFRYAYAYAREAWISGDEEVVFPAGTYKLRIETPARCRGPDPACA
jgi:putative transposase